LISIANTQVTGLGTASTKNIPATGDASITEVVYGTDTRLTNTRTPSDLSVTTGKIVDGNVTNVKLANSSVTIGSTSVSLGATAATVAGLTLTTPVISSISNSGTVTVPTGNTTLLGTATATTKGDLYVATASNTVARLGVGANNYQLVADSAATSGMAWKDTLTPSAGSRNESLSVVDVAPRAGNFSGTMATGVAYFTFFTPRWDLTVDQITVSSAGTASTGLTSARLGLYTFSGGTATLVARTAVDSTLFGTSNTAYIRSFDTTGGFPSTYSLVAGTRYALGVIVVGSSPGTVYTAFNLIPSTLSALEPRMTAAVTGQSDLPTTASSFTTSVLSPWGRFD
jgi:hypothetical protein